MIALPKFPNERFRKSHEAVTACYEHMFTNSIDPHMETKYPENLPL